MSEALGIQSVTSSLDSAAALSGGSQLFHSEDRSAERAISHVGSMSESVIHHALRGGVFRWLQTLATREFSRLIQVLSVAVACRFNSILDMGNWRCVHSSN